MLRKKIFVAKLKNLIHNPTKSLISSFLRQRRRCQDKHSEREGIDDKGSTDEELDVNVDLNDVDVDVGVNVVAERRDAEKRSTRL